VRSVFVLFTFSLRAFVWNYLVCWFSIYVWIAQSVKQLRADFSGLVRVKKKGNFIFCSCLQNDLEVSSFVSSMSKTWISCLLRLRMCEAVCCALGWESA
jgi:hypothetical protein